MALLHEGAAIIITNLRASTSTRTSSNSNNILSLASSKSTRLFKDISKSTPSSDYYAFKIIDSKQFSKLKDLKVSETVDLIEGIVLGRCGNYFWIGASDDTDGSDPVDFLVCLKNFTTSVTLSSGDSINFRDLSFNHFDYREGVAHFNFTEYSDFKKKEIPRSSSSCYKKSQDRFIELTK